jgi:hypothetical protein
MNQLTISGAKLPASYEDARKALAKCEAVDECKDWADKAAALASYGRQVKDETLVQTADRIRARAMRRAGELLKEVDARGGDRRSNSFKKGDVPLFDKDRRTATAAAAGFSDEQRKNAITLANIPIAAGRPP